MLLVYGLGFLSMLQYPHIPGFTFGLLHTFSSLLDTERKVYVSLYHNVLCMVLNVFSWLVQKLKAGIEVVDIRTKVIVYDKSVPFWQKFRSNKCCHLTGI